MAAFPVRFWSTLDAYFIRIEIKLDAEISVSLLALHALYTSEKKSVCIPGTAFFFNAIIDFCGNQAKQQDCH